MMVGGVKVLRSCVIGVLAATVAGCASRSRVAQTAARVPALPGSTPARRCPCFPYALPVFPAREYRVSLRWDAVDGAAFYNVYETDTDGGLLMLSGQTTETEWDVLGVRRGQAYWFAVTTVDGDGVESAVSDLVRADIPQ